MDTLICHNKKDAHKAIDNIGGQFIEDWEYLPEGKIKLILRQGWNDGKILKESK